MSDFNVSTTAELGQALAMAQSGDTIALGPGVYSNVDASGFNFASAVNVVSQDPTSEAVLTDLSVIESSGLHFANLEFAKTSQHLEREIALYDALLVREPNNAQVIERLMFAHHKPPALQPVEACIQLVDLR